MKMEKMIRMLCAYEKISISELARRLGDSQQNFSQKLKRESFSIEELQKIAEAVGAEYINYFQFPNGDKIQ